MTFLADECCDTGLVASLRADGYDVLYISERKPGLSDDNVLIDAYNEERILLTEDKDFGELVYRLKKPTRGIKVIKTEFKKHHTGGKKMLTNVIFRVEIFKEEDQFIALCPELNVSSYDATFEGAKRSIHEAVELFLEECEEAGILEEVLEESGFQRMHKPEDRWVSREPIAVEKVSTVAL